MKHSYIIIDDDPQSILKTLAVAARFQNLQFVASANDYDSGLDLILEHKPKIVFLEIDPEDKSSNLSLALINELYRYLINVPKIIVTTKNKELAYEAIKYEVFDYFTKPVQISDFRKTILKYEKTISGMPQFVMPQASTADIGEINIVAPAIVANEVPFIDETVAREEIEENHLDTQEETIETESEELIDTAHQGISDMVIAEPETIKSVKQGAEDKPLIICVKSYGDYRFIEAKDICYLQADNNSTDIHLYNGEMITAFKTLKHFEGVLSSPFVRIHNSYIVNIDYVSRIHTGNAVCYIKNTTTKLPFSKSYKENVDSIINSITNGNYLEI
jgi:DNA-binding LytR/AlgR family response regulator